MPQATTLPGEARALLDGPTFGTLATTNDDGSVQLTVHWVARDGDDVLLSTLRGRKKERNLRRDPRASLLVIDPADPQRYLEIRGSVTITEDVGRAFNDDLHVKYLGGRPIGSDDPPGAVRVVLRLRPEWVVWRT